MLIFFRPKERAPDQQIAALRIRRGYGICIAPVEAVSHKGAGHALDVIGLSQQKSGSLNVSLAGYDPAARQVSLDKIDTFLAEVLKK